MVLGHQRQDKRLCKPSGSLTTEKSMKSETYAGSHSLDLLLKSIYSVSQNIFK